MQYSPKLKTVMAEIQNIMKKNDIGGICVLYDTPADIQLKKDGIHVTGFSEFLFYINTSFTVAQFEGDMLKVRAKAIHYPSKEHRDIALAKTFNMITHLRDVTRQMAMQAANIHGHIKKLVDSTEGPGSFTNHTTQNN